MIGCEYALGLNSCASGILLMLMVLGVKPGDKVLSNGFTFTALPSSILRINAVPVLVECKDNWTIDLEDLERKMDENPDAKVLLLSHMRGKVVDMDALKAMCDARGVSVPAKLVPDIVTIASELFHAATHRTGCVVLDPYVHQFWY